MRRVSAPSRPSCCPVAKVRLGIGAAEAVDRLLRIADDDRLPLDVAPRRVARQAVDDLRLRPIGVLELVDEDVVVLAARALEHFRIVEHGERAEEEIVEVDDAEGALLAVEERHEAARHGVQRHRGAVRHEAVVDRVACVAGAEDLQRVAVALRRLVEVDVADQLRDRREVVDPFVDAGAALGSLRAGDVAMERIGSAAQREERGAERVGAEREIAEVVAGLVEEIAPVDEREDHVADLEEIAGVREEHLPLAQRFGRRLRARLLVDPGVVQLRVQERPLEPFDDLELRIEARLDRELPQERLAERVNGLRSEEVDARELRAARARRVASRLGSHERMGRVRRPRDCLVCGPATLSCASTSASAAWMRSAISPAAFSVNVISTMRSGERFSSASISFSTSPTIAVVLPVPAPASMTRLRRARRRRRAAADIEERLLEGHERSSCCSNVRGSRSCATAYFSSASCFVRQEWFTGQYLHELKSLSFSFGNAGKRPCAMACRKISSVSCSRAAGRRGGTRRCSASCRRPRAGGSRR